MLMILALAQVTPAPPPTGTAPVPVTSPSTWISYDDYPQPAREAGQSGVVGFRLDIGITGRVTGCTITQTSGSPSLDSTTCTAIIRRARFHPALGANAEPIASSWSSRIHWVVPDDTEPTVPTFRPWAQISSFEIGKGGRLDHCRTTSPTMPPADALDLCKPVNNSHQTPDIKRFLYNIRHDKPGMVAVEFGANPETLLPLRDRAWVLPGRRLRSLDTVTFALTADGRVRLCEKGPHSGNLPAGLDLCALLRKAYDKGDPDGAAGTGVAWFAISTGSSKEITDFQTPSIPTMR